MLGTEDKRRLKPILARLKEGYPISKYENSQSLVDYTKECDILIMVDLFEKLIDIDSNT